MAYYVYSIVHPLPSQGNGYISHRFREVRPTSPMRVSQNRPVNTFHESTPGWVNRDPGSLLIYGV